MTDSRYHHSKPEHDEVVRNWRHHTANEVRHAVAQVTKDLHDDLRPELTELLDHEDWSVRLEALTGLLARLGEHEYLDRAIDGLEHEAPEVAEDIPMILWRYVKAFAPERYSEIMELLVRRLLTVPERDMQRNTYNAILQLGRIGERLRLDHLPADFDLGRDVDWEPLLKWVPEDLEVPEGVISSREVSTPEDLDLLRDPSAPTDTRVGAMDRLLLDRRQEARAAIQALYRSDDPELALEALRNYVAVWGTVDMVNASAACRSDNEEVALAAVEAVAQYSRNLDGGRNLPVSHLVRLLRSDGSTTVRKAAYEAVLEALDEDALVPDDFDPDRDIDWDVIDADLA